MAGGPPASLVTQTAGSNPGPGGVLKTAFRLSSKSCAEPKLLDITTRPAVERAQLPEVSAIAASGIPNNEPVSELAQSAMPSPSIEAITELTAKPQSLDGEPRLPVAFDGINLNDNNTGETDPDEQRPEPTS